MIFEVHHRKRFMIAKHTTAMVMLLVITIQIFWSSGYLVDSYTDLEACEALCLNKDKPDLKCDGKYILVQKIAAANQSKNQKDKSLLPPMPILSTNYVVAIFFVIFNLLNKVVIYDQIWQEHILKALFFPFFKSPT